jgi:hypothetical protein
MEESKIGRRLEHIEFPCVDRFGRASMRSVIRFAASLMVLSLAHLLLFVRPVILNQLQSGRLCKASIRSTRAFLSPVRISQDSHNEMDR